MKLLCVECYFSLTFLLISSITVAQNIGIATIKPSHTLVVNGRLQVINGVIENGNVAITSTADLGLYYQTDNNLSGQSNTDSLKREMAKQKKAAAAKFSKTQLLAMITKTDGNLFGYYILADGNILIDQKNIPAIPGNNGFVTGAEAKRTADFAIKKLKEGEMPPTITDEDLKKLKITLPPIKN